MRRTILIVCSLVLIFLIGLVVTLKNSPSEDPLSHIEVSSVLNARGPQETVAVRFHSRQDWPTDEPCDITVSVSQEIAKHWQVAGISVYECKDGDRFLMSSKTPILYEKSRTHFKWGMPAVTESRYDLELYLKKLASSDSGGTTVNSIPHGKLVQLTVTPQNSFQ